MKRHDIPHVLGDHPVPLFALCKTPLGRFFAGDVAGNTVIANKLALLVEGRTADPLHPLRCAFGGNDGADAVDGLLAETVRRWVQIGCDIFRSFETTRPFKQGFWATCPRHIVDFADTLANSDRVARHVPGPDAEARDSFCILKLLGAVRKLPFGILLAADIACHADIAGYIAALVFYRLANQMEPLPSAVRQCGE